MAKFLHRRLIPFLFLIPFIFFSQSAKATHMMGADITYRCVDTLKFEITLKWYRDCRGIGLNNGGALTIRCTSGGSRTATLTLKSIREITPVCATEPSRCKPSNTYGTGEGVEEHTYTGILDFNTSPLSALAKCSGQIIIGGAINARNGAITTGPSGTLYTDCTIDLNKAPCNTSPALTSEPIAILCCDQPFYFNNGALDTANFDSLSYAWANPQRGYNNNTSYSGQFTYLNPFTVYDPRPNGGAPIPGGNPPIGLYLDPLTGDIVLTPTNCSEVTVAVIEITEWRKNAKGKYEVIGKTRRDMQFIVKSCPGNKPPIVNGPYTYDVCEGSQLCFNITTNDPQFVPPPPAPLPAPDTVTISWNKGIPGATFTVTNPTARLQTGRFCWTPGAGQASNLPYSFTVTARDDACPLNAVSVRAFRIKVKPRAQATIDIDTMDCGVYPIEAVLSDGFKGTASYNWTILDSNNNIVFSRKIASFKKTGNFLSTSKQDTIQFKKGGLYYIQLALNNSPINCPSTFVDTLVVPPLLEADLSIGQDTFVCAGTDILFKPYLSNYNAPVTYQWSTMGVTNDGTFLKNATADTTNNKDSFLLSIPNVQYDTAVSIFIKDASGCSAEDTVQVFLKSNPLAKLPPDPRICSYDSILIVPNLDSAYWVDPIMGDTLVQGDTLFKEWYHNGVLFDTKDSVTIHKAGIYVIKVIDSLNCMDTDTMFLNVNDTVTAFAGNDTTLCLNETILLRAQGMDTAGNSNTGLYRWSDITPTNINTVILGTNDQYDIVATDDEDYRLELYITQGGVECFDDDTMKVFVNPLPNIVLGTDESVCCDYGPISLGFKLTTPAGNPTTGFWSCTSTPSLISGGTFDTDAGCGLIVAPAASIDKYAVYTYTEPNTLCVNKDSIRITINSLPKMILQDRVYCQDIGAIRLDDDVVISPSNTSLGSPSWKCLDSNSTNNRFFADMLENRGSQFAPDYWLKLDESVYTIQNSNTDTIVLEFTYVNRFGCRAKDTVSIEVSKVPKLTFSAHRDLCYDEGVVDLNNLMDVNLTDGIWSVVDVPTTYRDTNDLGGISNNSINTFNSVPMANSNITPNSWKIRYTHTATGCPTFKDTTLRINPLPAINLTPLTPKRLCETAADVTLNATPAGGAWSSNDPSAIVGGNKFSPSSAALVGNGDIINLYYNYTDASTGCSNVDSIDAQVDPKPTISLPTNAVYCRNKGEMVMPLTLPISATNNSSLIWIPTNIYGNRDRINAGAIDNTLGEGIITLTLQNQKADTFRIGANAGGLASCSDVNGSFEIIINPIPEATITNSNPEGCNPVTTDLGVVFNNEIDPVTATYAWNLGNGNSANLANNTVTYTNDGQAIITLVVTSDKGCDTTISNSVLINPIPIASFVPNPNNYTTAALPRFIFTNTSTVDPINGSVIDQFDWDFGDPNSSDDVSSEENPSHYYPTDTAEYCVNLKVTTNKGCSDEFNSCVVIGPDLIVFIPNAFTPNASGPNQNEGFKAIISGEKTMELIVFDRWGEIMFITNDVNEKWNGMYKGQPAQQDVYAYQLNVTALNDEVYTYTGTITLIR